MKKLLGIAALLVALTAFAVTVAAADTGGTDRPFTGTLVGSASFVAPDFSCPLGFRTVSQGSGTGSHLGLVSFTSDHCFALPNLMTQGQATLVAANGDELHMTYAGTCNPPAPPVGGTNTCIADNVIVGGTGRFADATGEAKIRALITNPGSPPFPITWTWEGTLSY